MHHGLVVRRSDADGGVRRTGGGTTDEQRQAKALAGHLLGDMNHLVQRRGDQSRQADRHCACLFCSFKNFLARHHHAKIMHLVVVAGQYNSNDVFADVVNIAFDGRGDNQRACVG